MNWVWVSFCFVLATAWDATNQTNFDQTILFPSVYALRRNDLVPFLSNLSMVERAKIGVIGSGHSFNANIWIGESATEALVWIRLSEWNQVTFRTNTVQVEAGVTFARLLPKLEARGLTLPTMSDTLVTTVVGSCVGYAHGSGNTTLVNFVESVRILNTTTLQEYTANRIPSIQKRDFVILSITLSTVPNQLHTRRVYQTKSFQEAVRWMHNCSDTTVRWMIPTNTFFVESKCVDSECDAKTSQELILVPWYRKLTNAMQTIVDDYASLHRVGTVLYHLILWFASKHDNPQCYSANARAYFDEAKRQFTAWEVSTETNQIDAFMDVFRRNSFGGEGPVQIRRVTQDRLPDLDFSPYQSSDRYTFELRYFGTKSNPFRWDRLVNSLSINGGIRSPAFRGWSLRNTPIGYGAP